MSISMYQISIPPLMHALNNLAGILKKGEEYAKVQAIDPTDLLNSRLVDDMYTLTQQVQIAADISKLAAARLAGVDITQGANTETTFAELISRLYETIGYLKDFTVEQIDGTESKEVDAPLSLEHSIAMQGLPFISFYILPNFYFHMTTAYGILRHNGVELGKLDFLGSASN